MKPEKKQIIDDFKHHVSSGKVAVYKKYGMQFVMGERQGAYMTDVSGSKTLITCHCNGGVFNSVEACSGQNAETVAAEQR